MPHKTDSLKPLRKARHIGKFAVFDIESENWKDFRFCGFCNPKKEYIRWDSIEDTVKGILSHKHRNIPIYAHNLSFDGMFILDHITYNRPDLTVVPLASGSRLLELKIKDANGHKWRLRDSLSILPSSLMKLTHDFNVEHKKMKESEAGMLSNPEYNRNDCLGLYEVLDKYLNSLNREVGLTISQTSMMNYRAHYQKQPVMSMRGYEKYARTAYHGARTEIYRYNFDMDKKLYYFDVNSLYPYCMREFEYPFGKWSFTSPDISLCGFSYAKFDDSVYFPIVPQKVGGKTMFLNGMKEGWFTNQELRYVESLGLERMDVLRTVASDQSGSIFREFVDDTYSKRLAARGEGNSALAYALKIILNSNYGKWGERRERYRTVFNPEEIVEGMNVIHLGGGKVLYQTLEPSKAPHIIPSISAFVTAYARIHMHKLKMRFAPDEIYYEDTDSLIVDNRRFSDSKELGQLKLEHTIHNFMCLLPKLYYFTDEDDNPRITSKGVRLRGETDMPMFRDYIAGKPVEESRGIETFRRAVISSRSRSEDTLLFRKTMSRSIKSYYDKRRIEPYTDTDFICRPFGVSDDRSANEKPFADVKERMLLSIDRIMK